MAFPSPHPAPPSPRPPSPSPPPPPPLPQQQQHDTTLRLSLALPSHPLPYAALGSPKPAHARRPRTEGGAALARVRPLPTGDAPPSPCTECGRTFPSWKALFGHMRCHPERMWRGITPPPSFRHDGVASPTAACQFTLQEREVAASLLMLSGARPAVSTKGKKISGLTVAPPPPFPKDSCAGTSAAAASPSPSPSGDGHKCGVCDRGFASGQALGGHKRCHWERTCADLMVVAAADSSTTVSAPLSEAEECAAVLDLNLPLPSPRDTDHGAGTLDLKLGLQS